MQRQLSEDITMRNEEMIIYFCLNRFRELVFRKKEDDVMIKILIEYIIKNHNLKHVKSA